MKPAPFEFHAPTTVEEAIELLAELGDDAKVLAGGQSLVPLLALRMASVRHLIDINGVESLQGIHLSDGVEIGAVTRHRGVERSSVVGECSPLLAAATKKIGHVAIRSRGTVGGSIAHADPAAELPAVLTALDGSVIAEGTNGRREIAAADLFTGFLSTSIEPDELLVSVQLPPWDRAAGWSVQEFARRDGDFALAGCATVLAVDGTGRIGDARIALFGVASVPVRATAAEKLLVGEAASAELWADASSQATADLDPPSDLHGSAAYRRHLAGSLVRRSLAEAALRTGVAA